MAKVAGNSYSPYLHLSRQPSTLPYGFRPGRSQHQAIDALWRGLMDNGGGWVIDLDIQSFFDSVDRAQLRSFLDQRVRDGVIRRAIGKWLKAGVMEEDVVWYPEQGTPQGGVVSPLLSNIFLHEVLDIWFHQMVQPRMKGRSFMVRYADDAVLGFAREDDVRRVLAVLPKRFGKFGLTLHPDKTRLVDFRRPRRDSKPTPGQSFDMLGFTHYWGKSRKGQWVVKRKTAKGRFSRAVMRIGRWCRTNRHLGDVPAAVEFGRVAAAPVNTLRQQPHRCQEISVCF